MPDDAEEQAPPVVAVMVAILNVPGLLIYIFLRPRETLSEAYERSLEEEALLQEIEEKPVCPGCLDPAAALGGLPPGGSGRAG